MLLVACVAMWCTSCSKDDDSTNQKQVKSITWKSADGETEITTFEYDNHNRVIKETWEEDGDEYVSFYSYKDNEVIMSDEDGKYHYTLKNGLVVSDDNGNTYEYNNAKQLVKYGSYKYTWQNDNIIKCVSGSEEYNYTYTSYEDKLNLDFYSDYNLPEYWYLGCYGKGNKNLVQTINAYGNLYSFEYKFTDDGYVTEVKIYDNRTGEAKHLHSTHIIEYK